jgi:hypothetical protein
MFVELGNEEECIEEDCIRRIKTCPSIVSSDPSPMNPMKVELLSDVFDPVSSQAGEQMSEASTSAGCESDEESIQLSADDEEKGTTLQFEPLSKGSAFHEAGACEPCAWFWKPGGCRWGQNCARCHLCAEGETKLRRKQKQLKQAADRVRGALAAR